MSAPRSVLSAVADAMAPDSTLVRLRLRVIIDTLLTIAVTVLAVALAGGYQVLGRWARRSRSAD